MESTLHNLTPRPPLGWNSYDSFGAFVNEQRALENLEVFVDRLQPHGYQYFVIDIAWYRDYGEFEGEFPDESDEGTLLHDRYGRPIPAPQFFPGGFQPLADACHAEGVKFGIHMMRGIPRNAVEANTPIKGTDYRAQDVAETQDTCEWCPDNYGVDMDRPGAQSYYDSIIELLASWGVDFIKYDDMIPSPPEIHAVVDAIEKVDRDMVLSLSPGNGHEDDGWDAYFRANMIRTSGDIWDSREDFRWVFERWEDFQPLLGQLPNGCWLDMDMIPFGELEVPQQSGNANEGDEQTNGKGTHRMCRLNLAQKRTFITMRALGASPLFMGGNLPGTDEESFDLLTDEKMLACNQNGVTGRLVTRTDWTSTWKAPHREQAGAGWFGIFNRDGELGRDLTVDADELGIPRESRIFDIWKQRDLGDLSSPINISLKPDEVFFAQYE